MVSGSQLRNNRAP